MSPINPQRNVISTNGASEFWLRNEKIYNIKVEKYTATTKVNLNNKFIGEFKWSNINELNKGLTNLTKNHNAKK